MEKQVCTRCVMTSEGDPTIRFSKQGYCNYCTKALEVMNRIYFPNEEGEHRLQEMIQMLRAEGQGKVSDCLMGISGGLDSAYLAYLATQKWGLRVTAVHIDDGFDTEIAKANINRLCEKCDINLIIITPDSKQFNELARAYMLAGVPNLAVPQDNTLVSYLFRYAKENNMQHLLSGGNFALECILQQGHTMEIYDLVNLKDINNRFGRDKLDRLELMGMREKYLQPAIKELRPLNYIEYNREQAFSELKSFCGFEYYGAKHLENYYTAFLQLYWLPKRFGVDKRTSHLSSMIVSGQMSREQALAKLHEPLYDTAWMDRVIQMIKEQFEFTDQEFDEMMQSPVHEHTDYATDTRFERYRKRQRFYAGVMGKLYATYNRMFRRLEVR